MKNENRKAFSLIELLVSIGIFLLAIAGITYLVFIAYNYYRFIFNQAEILGTIEKSVNLMSKEMREMRQADSGAFSIGQAQDDTIVFYSNVDNDPDVERIRYFTSSKCLKREVVKPTGDPPQYLDTGEQTSNITCNVDNYPSEPIFTYYNGYPSESTLMETPAEPNQVKIIKLYLRIASSGKDPVPTSKIISLYTTPRNINQEK